MLFNGTRQCNVNNGMLFLNFKVYTSPGNEGVIYNISWAPANLNCIVACTSKNGAFIWDIGRGKVTKRFTEVRYENI